MPSNSENSQEKEKSIILNPIFSIHKDEQRSTMYLARILEDVVMHIQPDLNEAGEEGEQRTMLQTVTRELAELLDILLSLV